MNVTRINLYTMSDLKHIILTSNNSALVEVCKQELTRRLSLINTLTKKGV